MSSPVVLVTRRDDEFSAFLRDNGCRVLNVELIETVPLEDLSDLTTRMNRIHEYDGLFITSPVAAEVFVQRQRSAGSNFRGPVYVLGERARDSLRASGLNVVFREQSNTAEDLINSFDDAEFADKKLLFIRGDKSMRTIPHLLSSTARLEEVIVYRTLECRPEEKLCKSVQELFDGEQIDWVCFFSPSAVRSFINVFGRHYSRRASVAVIGETTARCAYDTGLSVDFVSPKASAEVFARHLIEHFKNL